MDAEFMPTCRCGGSVGKNSSTGFILCCATPVCIVWSHYNLYSLFTFLALAIISWRRFLCPPDVLSDLINILVNETVNSCSSFVNILVCFCVCGERLQLTGSRCHRQILRNVPTPKEGNYPPWSIQRWRGKKMSKTPRSQSDLSATHLVPGV